MIDGLSDLGVGTHNDAVESLPPTVQALSQIVRVLVIKVELLIFTLYICIYHTASPWTLPDGGISN